MSIVITDDKERVIIKINNGKIAAARYIDLDERIKDYVVDLYRELIGMEDAEKLKKFLNFEEENDEFCV